VAGQPASPEENAESDLDLLDDPDAEYDDAEYQEYYDDDEDRGEDDEAEQDGSAFDSMLSSSHDRGESRPRRRRPMWGGWALLVVFVLLLVGGGVWLHDLVTRPPAKAAPSPPSFAILPLDVNPGDSVPSAPAAIPVSVPGPKDPQVAWMNKFSTETYMPGRALSAYLNAQTLLAQRDPSCGINWTTLAGIGWIESHHGQFGGDSIGPDDREAHPIIGPALDGSDGVQRISDTDHGTLDGDPVWDHALGPMQFLPSTWQLWGLRASGDGKAPDPQNIADAALTAGNYLCRSVGDMAVPANWWKGVYVYNNSQTYGVEVYSAAQAYSDATR
jgi:hypothetical protein